MEKNELLASEACAKLSQNKMKSTTLGLPEGELTITVVGQNDDFKPGNSSATIPMVGIIATPKGQNDWNGPYNVAQGSLAAAIRLSSDEEWERAKTEKTEYNVRAQRAQPATLEEIQRGKGKMKFTLI